MTGRIYLLTTRHEQKFKAPWDKIKAGSPEDQRAPLSVQGVKNAYATGKRVLPKGCDVVLGYRSNLVRTTMTLQHMFDGAGYDADKDVQWAPEDGRIGLVGFEHEEFPPYSHENPAADNYVAGVLTGFWKFKGDPTPVVSGVAFALLDNIVNGIETGLWRVRQGAEKVLVAQATHAPLIDSLDAVLYNTLVETENGMELMGWPGHYKRGEFMFGENVGGISDNPHFLLEAKNGRKKAISLDDLKKLREKTFHTSVGFF